MFTETQASHRHFSTFYEDNTLLIQFIVVEFIQIYHLTSQIKRLIQNRLNPLSHSDPSAPFVSPLTEMLIQLVGYFPQKERPSSSYWTKGPLTKFKEYCEKLSLNSHQQNKEHRQLHRAAYQIWLSAIHHMELLHSLHLNPYIQNSEAVISLLHLKRTLNTLEARFNQVMHSLPLVLISYSDNENVILCLLRKKAQLSEIYGSDFLHKQFKWPMKSKELIQLLTKRYQERGFEGLLPTIQQIHDAEEKSDVLS